MVIDIKEIGTIRKLDELGRIVIPKSVREKLNMEQGDNIEFYVDDNKVLLKKSALIDVHEEEIYKLLQLYYSKYYKSCVMVEGNKTLIEYGKDIDHDEHHDRVYRTVAEIMPAHAHMTHR